MNGLLGRMKQRPLPRAGGTAFRQRERGGLQRRHGGELRIVPGIVQQEKLLAALFGNNLRDDGMVELLGGILRGDGARLIAISEEILARLLVADDTDLQDTFPLLELVEGKGPQEFE